MGFGHIPTHISHFFLPVAAVRVPSRDSPRDRARGVYTPVARVARNIPAPYATEAGALTNALPVHICTGANLYTCAFFAKKTRYYLVKIYPSTSRKCMYVSWNTTVSVGYRTSDIGIEFDTMPLRIDSDTIPTTIKFDTIPIMTEFDTIPIIIEFDTIQIPILIDSDTIPIIIEFATIPLRIESDTIPILIEFSTISKRIELVTTPMLSEFHMIPIFDTSRAFVRYLQKNTRGCQGMEGRTRPVRHIGSSIIRYIGTIDTTSNTEHRTLYLNDYEYKLSNHTQPPPVGTAVRTLFIICTITCSLPQRLRLLHFIYFLCLSVFCFPLVQCIWWLLACASCACRIK